MIFNYIRVSTAEQKTDRQLKEVDCDKAYIEKISAKDTNRPELQQMLGKLREGDVINVHELSRLARSVKDLLQVLQQILDEGASIKFHKENLYFEAGKQADPFQKLQLTMLGAIADFERGIMLSRQAEGIAIAKEKGKYRGRVCRFTKQQLEEIRSKFKAAKKGERAQIARDYGISRQHLYTIAKEQFKTVEEVAA